MIIIMIIIMIKYNYNRNDYIYSRTLSITIGWLAITSYVSIIQTQFWLIKFFNQERKIY